MMMTQSYYAGDLNTFGRSSQRAPSTGAYYGRPLPYSHHYYGSHQDLRSEFVGRSGSQTLIADQHLHDQHTHGHQRRRIQVACSRCRKRKIKCSGDPGNGSGCTSCQSAGVDPGACIFNRVGSHALATQEVNGLPTMGGSSTTSPIEMTSSTYDVGIYQTHHRQSLPMLQTRTAYSEYDYGPSPLDDYTYSSSMPRQSISGSHGAESFRPYTSEPLPASTTSTSMYYEPGTPFGFGSLQGAPPYAAAPISRVSSTAGDALSPLNMASMHSSLPSQTVQERRLPIPYQQAYPQRAATPEVPEIRPLGPFHEHRAHINGIYSRTGMPWTMGNSRSDSVSNPHHQAETISTSGEMNTGFSNVADPAFGYHFRASSRSPAVSPTTTSSVSGSFQATDSDFKSTPLMMMPPVSTKRSRRASTSRPNLPSLIGGDPEYRRSCSSHEAAASLFSFSTGIDTEPALSTDRQIVRQHRSNDDFKTVPSEQQRQQQRYASPRQSQPQHAASVDGLRRHSSLEHQQQQQQQQQQRAATAHRMSVSNLNARY